MNLFTQRDESPAYNITFRILSPIIFTIVISSLYYFLSFDYLVHNIWIIVPLYFAFRIIYNLLLHKWQLIDKRREIILSIISTLGTFAIYKKFIIVRANLLPDPANLTGELWIIIILYIYNTFNKIDVGTSGSEIRREKYYNKYYRLFKYKYGHIINQLHPTPILESLIYATIMYENFNRPPLFRIAERALFPFFTKTIGIMQVTTKQRITDNESVRIGSAIIKSEYILQLPIVKQNFIDQGVTDPPVGEVLNATTEVIKEVLKTYNKDNDYIYGVMELHEIILKKFYPQVEIIW
ncbi:hypothetical protein [Hymenobacter sp. BT730]|uniref:hypothetical protein n=1 Tax=Hymenobacter sp. BT730 TaxID=3063332 RepID=UPI0026DEEAF4|nr:hypothetical protein [Hymenobacter sp. BT730]